SRSRGCSAIPCTAAIKAVPRGRSSGSLRASRGPMVTTRCNMGDSADVVVVGSGAGGAPVAFELARGGARVVVLEKGRSLSPEELIHDELRVCRRNLFVPYISDEPHTLRVG